MRKRCFLLTILVVLGLGCWNARAVTDEALAKMDGDTVVRIHFAGTTRILSDPAAVKLNQLAAMPETVKVREMFVQKLSTAPFRQFRGKLANGNTNDYSALLRPLVGDLMQEESYVEMRGPGNAIPELMLAVHLDNARAKIWQDNLSMVISTWTGIPVQQVRGDGFTGWELKKHEDPNLIRCLRAGEWVVFGWGQNELRLQPGFVQKIKAQRRPVEMFKEGWLDATVDWPTLMRYHPFKLPELMPATLPKMHLTMMTRKDYMRSRLVMQFPEPLNLKLEPWKIPTNTIRNPLVSFTAIRGISSWLNQLEVVKKTQPPFVPNQLAFWSIAKLAFDGGITAPVSNAGAYLAQAESRLVPAINSAFSEHVMLGNAEWTNHEVFLSKLPFITPYLASMREPAGEFLMVGWLPPRRRFEATTFPPELMRELTSKPNLVFYSWEINSERIVQWQAFHQIYLMDSYQQLPPIRSPGNDWLEAAEPKLGNCATEGTLTAPNEITLERSAPVGLSGLELTLLEYWLDSSGFPLDASYPQFKGPVIPKKQNSK